MWQWMAMDSSDCEQKDEFQVLRFASKELALDLKVSLEVAKPLNKTAIENCNAPLAGDVFVLYDVTSVTACSLNHSAYERVHCAPHWEKHSRVHTTQQGIKSGGTVVCDCASHSGSTFARNWSGHERVFALFCSSGRKNENTNVKNICSRMENTERGRKNKRKTEIRTTSTKRSNIAAGQKNNHTKAENNLTKSLRTYATTYHRLTLGSGDTPQRTSLSSEKVALTLA